MSSALRRWIAGGCAVVLLVIGVQLLGTTSASAHSNAVVGSAQCLANGTYTVTWTITNDWNLDENAAVNSHTPAGSSLSANSLSINRSSAANHTGSITQTSIAGNNTAATLSVQGHWSDNYSQADKGSVSLAGTCKASHNPAVPNWAPGKCDSNFNIVSPTVTIPSDAGVTYRLDTAIRTAGTYQVDGGQHTITATSDSLTLIAPTSWTFTLASPPPTCNTTVTPVAPDLTQSKCEGHTPTAPTLSLGSTKGITYSVNKGGPYQAGDTVTVTATATDGYEFANTGAGAWTFVSKKKETLTFTFDAAPDCVETTTPVAPQLRQSVCDGNHPTNPVLTLAHTLGIDYTVTPDSGWKPGDTVVVTATLQNGFRFVAALPQGWVAAGRSASRSLTFDAAPDCRAITRPVAPSATQAECPESGTTVTPPTLTVPADTAQIHYAVAVNGNPASTGSAKTASVSVAPGDTVVVTATTQDGYKMMATLPDGWTRMNDAAATYTVTFDAGFSCGVPVNPSLEQSVCPTDGTTPVPPTLTLPTTDGVVYTADPAGPYKGGDTVVITAVAQTGHRFDKVAPDGWTLVDKQTERYTVSFDAAPACSVPATPEFGNDECVGDQPAAATYTIPETTGVDYFVDSVLTQAGTYTATDGSMISVEAKPQAGYTLVGTTSWSHTYPATPNCTPPPNSAKVAKATFSPNECVHGKPRGATYTVPSSTGVVYTANGKKVTAGTYKAPAGSTITVVATAKTGYTLKGTTTWSHSFGATPECHGTDAEHVHKPHAPLASTGVPTASLLIAGVGLLLVGGACTFLAAMNRRRADGTTE